jgi:protein-tyrosine phosphatase
MVEHGAMGPDHIFRVCFVCSGNICRSPMAAVVLRTLAERAELTALEVGSAGTGDWHVGERADSRALAALAAAGYDGSGHRGRQFDPSWFTDLDLVVALDRGHVRILRSWAPDQAAAAKIRLLRSFDPRVDQRDAAALDVVDPYYGSEAAFERVLRQTEDACRGLLAHAQSTLPAPANR